jgi:hypothetical protein
MNEYPDTKIEVYLVQQQTKKIFPDFSLIFYLQIILLEGKNRKEKIH